MAKKVRKLKLPRILELYIELEHTEPRVWRRVLVEDSITMYELHEIIQVVMGWMHSHLFLFQSKDLVITEPSPDGDWPREEFEDARKTRVASVFVSPGDSIGYEYDFGDSWRHVVRFEREFVQKEHLFKIPRCIGGANACPPEDCGGPLGFADLKSIIAKPKSKNFREMSLWLERYYPNYDPTEFSLGTVNKILKIGATKYLELMPLLYR